MFLKQHQKSIRDSDWYSITLQRRVSSVVSRKCCSWEAHMTRPFFQPKSSPISRPMKPRRSQSHIRNCASCCSKSSAADTQWKILDMCVRGSSIASMCFNHTDERRLALGTIWCKVNLYLWGRASFCIGCFAYDTCMFMVIRLACTYLCIFSAVLARLCIFYCVANRCVYSAECDGCTCRECYILCSTRWSESLYWSALNLDGCWVREAGFDLEISELMYSAPTCPWWLDHYVSANTWCCFYVGIHAIPLGGTAAGDSEMWDYYDSMPHTAMNLTVLSCAKVRNYYRQDRKTWEFPRFQVAGGPLYL